MILLIATTDKLQLVTDAAVTVDVHASFMDYNGTTITPGRQNTAITTATTTDIVAAPGASTQRAVKTLHCRNKHASSAVAVTAVYNQNGTSFELHKATLNAGEALEYVEGIGFFVLAAAAKLNKMLYVTSDVTNATISFADITGLTVSIQSGKKYAFEAHLQHQTNATTTGSRFGVNGPASPTLLIAGQISGETPGIAATNIAIGVATAYDTALSASTTGPGATNTLAIVSGLIQPSADGTLAMRCASEVAVAGGLIVKAGSWLAVQETDN